MQLILENAKSTLWKMVEDFGSDPYHLFSHLPEMEKWARFMLNKYPQADEEVVMLSVWLHDLGHYPIPTEVDHAVRGEQRAKEFLTNEGYDSKKTKEVLHCVRAHRCSDVMPQSLEAEIIAFIDSASHMTDNVYLGMAKTDKANGEKFRVYSKMERDLRDLSSFPEVQKELVLLYDAWKKLIETYEKLEFV